jgi:hypothetical protein
MPCHAVSCSVMPCHAPAVAQPRIPPSCRFPRRAQATACVSRVIAVRVRLRLRLRPGVRVRVRVRVRVPPRRRWRRWPGVLLPRRRMVGLGWKARRQPRVRRLEASRTGGLCAPGTPLGSRGTERKRGETQVRAGGGQSPMGGWWWTGVRAFAGEAGGQGFQGTASRDTMEGESRGRDCRCGDHASYDCCRGHEMRASRGIGLMDIKIMCRQKRREPAISG